ncbi:MAG: NAD(P)-binding domain-containing protein, partial [Chloroflexaceae bacterium]|nr:NAD(P)-binding domain-containing protein [Chloroflexaceae bacterium]
MNIGIIGAGNIGATAAALFIKVGHKVTISNSRGPDTLRELVANLGPDAHAASPEEAARSGDIVMEAIPFGRYASLPAADIAGKILI